MNGMEISQKNKFSRFWHQITLFYTIIFIIKGTRCNGIITYVSNSHRTSLNCHGLMPIYGMMYVWIGNIFEIVIFKVLAPNDPILHHMGHQVPWHPP